jgi:predicted ATPase
MAQWLLGYPDSARADTEAALSDARELGQAATLMNALATASHAIFQSGDYSTSNTLFDELVVLAEEKDSLAWKPTGKALQGFVLTQLGRHAEAVETIEAALAVYRITGATVGMPYALAHLAYACAQLGRYEDAEHFIEEAMALVRTTDERWCEAELIRIAGVIAISSGKAREEGEEYIERALTVARQQHAKSWELRAAMSMARLWRDQGKRQEARELLAPVNGWFTEGFDTRDLKEAKALLDELAS